MQVCSDLHVRSNRLFDYIAKTDADVLVIAGDLIPFVHRPTLEYLLETASDNYENVVYVPGNHEFYDGDLEIPKLRLNDNVYLLDNESVLINDRIIYGGTMWAMTKLSESASIVSCLNDFYLIKDFSIGESERLYYKFCSEFDESADVVVSHFGPSVRSIHPRYKTSRFNSYFCNDFLDKKHVKANLWIHGHTHSNQNYFINNTRVVCNPYGYRDENPDYKFDKIVEVL